MKNDNLHASQIKDLLNRVRNVETRSPMRSASVTDGNTNFIGNESLTVTGSQKVSGWLIVTGTLKVVGAFLLEGITTITGDVTITGKLLINGLAELTKTLTLKAGGKILVEGTNPITISQVAGAAVIDLSGAKVFGNATGGAFGNGTAVVQVSAAGPSMLNLAGSASVTVGPTRTKIDGGLDLANLPIMTKGTLVPNLYLDPTTKILYRLV